MRLGAALRRPLAWASQDQVAVHVSGFAVVVEAIHHFAAEGGEQAVDLVIVGMVAVPEPLPAATPADKVVAGLDGLWGDARLLPRRGRDPRLPVGRESPKTHRQVAAGRHPVKGAGQEGPAGLDAGHVVEDPERTDEVRGSDRPLEPQEVDALEVSDEAGPRSRLGAVEQRLAVIPAFVGGRRG